MSCWREDSISLRCDGICIVDSEDDEDDDDADDDGDGDGEVNDGEDGNDVDDDDDGPVRFTMVTIVPFSC